MTQPSHSIREQNCPSPGENIVYEEQHTAKHSTQGQQNDHNQMLPA